MASRRTRHLGLDTIADWRAPERLGFGLFAAPRDVATKLLHIGAEVEHSLAVQYLYAAYSLGGWHADPARRAQVQAWQHKILEIAREEMAHLATINNLLIGMGSPVSFEREEFPAPTDLYPFPFELKKLTKRTLGMYVLAEMPDESVLDQLNYAAEVQAIADYVQVGRRDVVHRVGHIYSWTRELIKPSDPAQPAGPVPKLLGSDFDTRSLGAQARLPEWILWHRDLLIRNAIDRDSSADAIKAIADQGEGTDIESLPKSHFGRFLDIYRAFPDDDAGWEPARNVVSNPTTDELVQEGRLITNAEAKLWAELFNVRYRMLLAFLAHAYRLESPDQPDEHTPRGLMISWAFGEMYNLRSIADILMELPLDDSGELRAGPPFEMPYTTVLPRHDIDCWRLHRELFTASQLYVQQIRKRTSANRTYLQALESADSAAMGQIKRAKGL